jgi:hypothetical protein
MSAALLDDTFQLYDLRVDVICPEGEKPLCGAKPGDYFTLQGEILYLPPGQGISIYSLCKFLDLSSISTIFESPPAPNLQSRHPTSTPSEAAHDTPK